MSNHTPAIDVADVITVEPSQRPEFFDLVVWEQDGEMAIICTDRLSVVEARLEVLHKAMATWDGFHGG